MTTAASDGPHPASALRARSCALRPTRRRHRTPPPMLAYRPRRSRRWSRSPRPRGAKPARRRHEHARRHVRERGGQRREPVLEHDDVVLRRRHLGQVAVPARTQWTVGRGRLERPVLAVARDDDPLTGQRVEARTRRRRLFRQRTPVWIVAPARRQPVVVDELPTVGEARAGLAHQGSDRDGLGAPMASRRAGGSAGGVHSHELNMTQRFPSIVVKTDHKRT